MNARGRKESLPSARSAECAGRSSLRPRRPDRRRRVRPVFRRARNRLQNVSKTEGETGGVEGTAVNESERCNRLDLKRLEPEVQRHQPLGKEALSEFESLPPSQPNSLPLRDLRLSRLGDCLPLPQ